MAQAYRKTESSRTGHRSFVILLVFAFVLSGSISAFAHQESPAIQSAAGQDKDTIPHPDVQTTTIPVIETNDISFNRLAVARGLSQTRVSAMAQDDRGFLWFGTQYGLDRYDGYRFKVFKHEAGRSNSLSGVYIHALFKDRKGSLWIGSDEFLDKFDPITETFTSYPVGNSDGSHSAGPIHHISQDKEGMLWLATGSGLYRLNPETHQTVRFGHVSGDPRSLSSNDIKFCGIDREGEFWAVTSHGVEKFDTSSGEVRFRIPFGGQEREASFYEDSFGTFWVIHASSKGGIAIYDRQTNRLTQYFLPLPQRTGQQLAGGRTILEDRDGNVWIGTGGLGLLRFDRANHRFVQYNNHSEDNESLADDHVTTLFQGRDGNIWAGLHQTVPSFFNTKPSVFEKFTNEPAISNRLGGSLVSSIYEDREGVLWISSAGALNRIDRRTGKNFLVPGGSIDNEAHTMVETPDGTMWIGTYMEGLKQMDRRTGRQFPVQFAASDSSSSPTDAVVRLLLDRSGALWAATWNGLKRFDLRSHTFTVYKPDPQSRMDYYDLAEDKQGMLWLAGSQGLHRFDPATGHFTVYRRNPGVPLSLSDNQVNGVHIEPDGSMWIATQNGFDQFDPRTATFRPYYESDGLAGNVVNCILGDGHGYLWMSTNNGLSKFDPRTRTFKNYSVSDGLPGPDLTGWGACSKSSSGEMFFGGFSGATAFYPDRVKEAVVTPRVTLTDFQLSGASAEVGNGSPLTRSISYTNNITLTHSQNIFSVEFSALNYFNAVTMRYRYKLDGLDHDWHEVRSDQRVASYTTLPSGTYTFLVQAATSRGDWGSPPTALRIEILPPWWNTWWFRTIYGVIAALCVCGLYRYRLYQIAQQFNMRLEERVGERTRIARELHDTLLQSFHGLVLQFQTATESTPTGTPARKMLEDVLNQSDQVLVEGRERVMGLRGSASETHDLPNAFSLARESLKRSHAGSFSVVVNGDCKPLHPIVRDEVYRIGREALANAFHHSEAQQIEVEISYERSALRLRFRDDGRGIDPAILERGDRTGHWGLPGMRERAKKIGARLAIWSLPQAGTEIELDVPAAIAYRKIESKTGWRWLRRNAGEES